MPSRAERFELPDGDFVDLVWSGPAGGALAVILHGLDGGFASPYVRRLMHALAARGIEACLMQFRGCGGEANRLPRSYHSGDTADLACLVTELHRRHPARPLLAAGFSMGGNVLLKWLGETGAAAPLAGAAAVSVPFELGAAADRLARGFSQVYQRHLVSRLRQRMRAKLALHPMPFDGAALASADTFRRYDETVTAPLHGFRDAEDYYTRASCRQYLHAIAVPTLIVHARDDPFLPAGAIPSPAECGAGVTLEIHARGGHLGFVTDPLPGLTRPWLETRLADFLAAAARASPGSRIGRETCAEAVRPSRLSA